MRKSIVILGACLVLLVGMAGCSDDDDIFSIPGGIDQNQIAAIAQGTTSGVAFAQSLAGLLLAPAAAGVPPAGCVDISQQCDLGGELLQCNTFEFIATACNVSEAGLINGTATITNPNAGEVTLNVSVDGTSLVGVINIIPTAGAIGCADVGYALTITSGGVETFSSGFLLQCEGGFPDGFLSVTIFDFNVSFQWTFNATEIASFQVFDLNTKGSVLANCNINLITNALNCS